MLATDVVAHWEGARRLFFKPWSVPAHSVFMKLRPVVQAKVKKKWKYNRGNSGAIQRRHGQSTEHAWVVWSQKKGLGVSFDELMDAVDEHWVTLVSQCSATATPTWSSDGFSHDVDAFTAARPVSAPAPVQKRRPKRELGIDLGNIISRRTRGKMSSPEMASSCWLIRYKSRGD